MNEVNMKNEILAVLQGRIAAGAGGLAGGALYDHNAYGQNLQMGQGAPAGAAKKRAPRKKKVASVASVDPLLSSISSVASELLSEGAGKKVKAPRKKKVGSEFVESNTSVLIPVSNQTAPPTGAAKKVRAGNKWIDHVKSVQKDKGITYTEALKVAKQTYKK